MCACPCSEKQFLNDFAAWLRFRTSSWALEREREEERERKREKERERERENAIASE